MSRVFLPIVIITLLIGGLPTAVWAQLGVTDGLVGWWDASDASTLEDAAGRNPGADGFGNMVITWRDKALANGAQDATIAASPDSDTPFTYSDGSSGTFETGAPYISSDAMNSFGFDDLEIATTSVFYVLNHPGNVDVTGSIAQMTLDGNGAIVYNRNVGGNIDQGGTTEHFRQLMVGIRDDVEFFSKGDVFLKNEPVVVNWTYGGGDRRPSGAQDDTSFQFYKNGLPWTAGETCCEFAPGQGGIGGSATDNRIGKEAGPGAAVDWAEVLIYDDVLTDDERRQVTEYLGEKYGIDIPIPPIVFEPPMGYAQTVHNSQPDAYYRFEENATGTAIDHFDTNGSNDGTYQGGVTSVTLDGNTSAGAGHGTNAGKPFLGLVDGNQALSFDGTGRVEVPDPEGRLDSSSKYSIEFLLQTAAGGGENQAIVSKGNFSDQRSTFLARVEEHVSAGINSGEVGGSTPDIAVGEWTHIVANFAESRATNDTEVLLYVNGEVVDERFPFEFQVPNAGDPLIIGAHDVNSFANFFSGAIDELAIYQRPLTDEEVEAHYAALFEAAGEPYEPGDATRPEPELRAGDANGDFMVDTADIIAVLAAGKFETGDAATFEQGDFNGDGVFNTGDIVLMLGEGLFETGPYASLGDVSNAGAGSVSRVPEPTTLGLLLMGMLAVAAGRRRYRR